MVKASEIKLSAIQLTSVPCVDSNLLAIEQQLANLTNCKIVQHIVVLPECCLFFGGKDAEQLALAKSTVSSQSLTRKLALLAQKYHIYLVAGSIPLLSENEHKFTNSCCVFSPDGQQLGQYDKIHLFDVTVEDNEKSYCESTYTQAGKQPQCLKLAEVKLGLTICYDLRFPELFRQLTTLGADIITVPSAFTAVTGKAHWQALLQARAIENQVYIIAAGQYGIHANGRETWGHSMIISPWGEILACKEQGSGMITADFLPDELVKVRAAIPVAKHNRFTSKLITI